MSVAPQIISPAAGTPQGAVAAFGDIDRIIAKLAAASNNFQPGTINADRLVANSITAGQIQAGSITTTQIQNGTITGDAGGAGTGDLATTTIVGGNIVTGSVNADRIIAGTITATQIAAGTIDATRLNVATLSAITAALGTVTSGTLSVGSGACVISDALGITIVQGATAPHNITWLTGSGALGTVLASDTSSGQSIFTAESYSPDQTKSAVLTLLALNGGAGQQEVALGVGPHNAPTTSLIMTTGGQITASHGVGHYGGTAPTTRPGTPAATAAAIITLLQSYNMCA